MHEFFRHKLALHGLLPPGQIISNWNVAPGDELVLITVSEADLERAHERNRGFACNRPDEPYGATLWRLSDKALLQTLELERLDFIHVIPQALSEGRFLLVGARCGPEDDFNAKVLSANGEVESIFKVGDAVEDVQIAQDDTVWVSYFDEGSLHNRAWNGRWDGLTEFDLKGNLKWQYEGEILDCYSLNVEKGDVYACYFTDFPVLRVSLKDKTETLWQNKFRRGCKALAVWGDKALLVGGYSDEFAVASLVTLGTETTALVKEFNLELPAENRLLTGRGPLLHYANRENWWTLDIRKLL